MKDGMLKYSCNREQFDAERMSERVYVTKWEVKGQNKQFMAETG